MIQWEIKQMIEELCDTMYKEEGTYNCIAMVD